MNKYTYKNKIIFTLGFIISLFIYPVVQARSIEMLPHANIGYIFTTNHTPLQVALAKGAAYQQNGFSLKELLPKEKYLFLKENNPIAFLDIIVTKSGSETSTLFAQKRLDIALASITAVFAGIDQGVPMKIVSPLVLVSGGVVVPHNAAYNDWPSFVAMIKANPMPVKIGYHSPTSAPIIILKGALSEEGLTTTQDSNDLKADVLLVDLKSTSNLLIALSSQQVDAVVGPEPLPQTAAFKNIGKSISELRNLPPTGKWVGFPCCVIVASDEFIAKHPELIKDFVTFMKGSIDWSNNHQIEAAEIAANWIGLPAEVSKKTQLEFINQFTEVWKNGAASYIDVLNNMDSFSGVLKNKTFNEVEALLIDYQFLGNP